MAIDETSHDPRTWIAGDAGPDKPATTASREPQQVKLPRMAFALAGSAAILAIGAVTARLSRPHVLPTIAAKALTKPLPFARRTLLLPDPTKLEQALVAVGVGEVDAQEAAGATLAAIGGAHGQLHIVASLYTMAATPRLVRLESSFDDSSGAVATRQADNRFAATKVNASLQSDIRVARGEMDASSFYSSAVAAGVTDTLIPQIAKALAFDFDFQREIHAGDVFEVAFEQMRNTAGQPVGTPRLLFVSLTTQDKSRSLYWYQPAGEEGGWFDGNGASTVRTLMRTPVDGARVSSTFGMRVHPIQGFMKMHKGIDFAAPIGTPIYAAGDAEVEFAGPKGPNGNFIKLRHPNGWETLYLHLDKFAEGVTTGAHVRQSQQIGEVGTTGNSTGPHLHYEVHIDDEPIDPATVKSEQGKLLTGATRDAFLRERDRIDVNRARQSS